MGPFGMPELMIVIFVCLSGLLVVWPAARICKRIGFSPWIGILAIIPVANLGLLWVVALSPWPQAAIRQPSA